MKTSLIVLWSVLWLTLWLKHEVDWQVAVGVLVFPLFFIGAPWYMHAKKFLKVNKA